MTITQPTSERDLKWLYCERFGCAPEEFERRALSKCLYLQARILAPFLRLFDHKWFERDVIFVRDLGAAKDWRQVMAELDAYHFEEHLQTNFARSKLRLRVSARKANKLAFDLFPSS